MRQLLPSRRPCENISLRRGSIEYIVSVGCFDDGSPSEVFVNADHAESGEQCAARDATVVLSIAFQHHISPEVLRRSVTRLENGKAASIVGDILDLLCKLQREAA